MTTGLVVDFTNVILRHILGIITSIGGKYVRRIQRGAARPGAGE